jgi:hypothetical protein
MERIETVYVNSVKLEAFSTPAGLLERDGSLPAQGFLKQEDIPLAPFVKTSTGALYGAI